MKGERALPCMPPLHFNSQRNHCFTSTLRPSHIQTRSTLCCVRTFPTDRTRADSCRAKFILPQLYPGYPNGCRDFDITEIDIMESDVTETDVTENDITESDVTESDIT